MNLFTVIRVIILFAGTLFFLHISKKTLLNFKVHGFYRFFAFELILILILINIPYWFKNPISILQIISWFFLLISICLVIGSVFYLQKLGSNKERKEHPYNFNFENTTNLVIDGIYKYIRHPMYSSLLFLCLGAFLKDVSIYSMILTSLVIGSLILTARTEEKENINFFGEAYAEYMKETKMFIPFIL